MRIELSQNTPAWHEFRSKRIGASDIPAITGRSPWTTAKQLWQRKLGIITPEPMNHHMKRGHALEEEARQLAIRELAIFFEPEVHVHPEYNWAMASLDGIDLDGECILEVKVPSKHHENIPVHYKDQIQFQMFCTGAKKCYFVSYCEGTLKIFVEKRNDEYIEELFHAAQEFRRMLLSFEEPPASKGDKEDLPELHDPEAEQWVIEYEHAARQADYWAQLKEELKGKLILKAGGKSVNCCGLKIRKIVKRGNVDYSSIPELKGVDVNCYRKTDVNYWSISR